MHFERRDDDRERNASYEIGAGKGKGRHYGYTNAAGGKLGTVNRYGNAAYAGGQIFVAVYGALRKAQRGGAVMKLTENQVHRIYEVLDASLKRIEELLKVKGGSWSYYEYLFNEKAETEKLIKKFEQSIVSYDSAIQKRKAISK